MTLVCGQHKTYIHGGTFGKGDWLVEIAPQESHGVSTKVSLHAQTPDLQGLACIIGPITVLGQPSISTPQHLSTEPSRHLNE